MFKSSFTTYDVSVVVSYVCVFISTFFNCVEVLLLFDEITQTLVQCWAWPDNRFDETEIPIKELKICDYSCVNCILTLPFQVRYKAAHLMIYHRRIN